MQTQTVEPQLVERLQAPMLPQANQDGTLDIDAIANGVEVRIPVYPGMQVGDTLFAHWRGTPSSPEIVFPEWHTVRDVEEITVLIPASAVYDQWQHLKVWYAVRGAAVGDVTSEVVEAHIVR